jgi:hypothetical protein
VCTPCGAGAGQIPIRGEYGFWHPAQERRLLRLHRQHQQRHVVVLFGAAHEIVEFADDILADLVGIDKVGVVLKGSKADCTRLRVNISLALLRASLTPVVSASSQATWLNVTNCPVPMLPNMEKWMQGGGSL